jgi:hypothetical protein
MTSSVLQADNLLYLNPHHARPVVPLKLSLLILPAATYVGESADGQTMPESIEQQQSPT